MSRPWTEEHEREALRRTYEIAAEITTAGSGALGDGPADGAFADVESEDDWRVSLAPYLTPERLEREVCRVRGLAEGRLVRETSERWHVRLRDNSGGVHTSSAMTEDEARREAAIITNPSVRAKVVPVRVTRIRKADAS